MIARARGSYLGATSRRSPLSRSKVDLAPVRRDKAGWLIPAEPIKMKEPHVFPLASSVVALMPRLYDDKLLLNGRYSPQSASPTSSYPSSASVLRGSSLLERLASAGSRRLFPDRAALATQL